MLTTTTTTTTTSARLATTPSHNRVGRLRVEGGYVDGIDLLFAAGGNVLYGAPGTGKSTTLSFLRYVLMLPVPEEKRGEFDAVIRTNLGSGRVFITLVGAHGAEVEWSRAGGDAAPRRERPKGAGGGEEPFSPDTFPVRFAGHGEFQLMAMDGLARLELVAGFAWDDVQRLRADIARVRRELGDNAVPLLRVDREIAELKRKCANLPAERVRLEELKKAAGGDPLELEKANQRRAARERERMTVEAARRGIDWLGSELGVFVATARRRLGQVVETGKGEGARPEEDGEPALGAAIVAEVGARIQRTAGALEAMAARVAEECAGAHATLAERGQALAELHSVEDDAYRALLATHEHDAARAFERLTLEKGVATLAMAADELAARAEERAQLVRARDALRARSRALLGELSKLLDETARRLTAELEDRVRITMVPESDRTAFRALLGELVKGKRFEGADLDVVAASLGPDALCEQVLRGDSSVLEEKLGSKAVAVRLVSVLLDSPRVYELETVDVLDVPTIALLHGGHYKPSHELSSGQRTVAFVSILLLDRRGPLVVDQPEDNVANPYLAKHLCGVLARMQEKAQFIFVSHNGNIPILGKAERVFELQADGARGWVSAQGDPKTLVEPMEDNFEGGRGAFVARKEFYGVE